MARLLVLIAILLCGAAFDASAALVKDSQSQGTCGGCTTLTVSHTVGTGSERLLLIQIPWMHNGSHSITSVTYGGVSATYSGVSANGGCYGYVCVVETWSIIAPVSGVADIVVSSTGNYEILTLASSYTGVDQTTALGAVVSAAGFSNAPSLSVSSANTELVSGALIFAQSSSGLATVGGATQLALLFGGAGYTNGASSYMPGAASTTYGWTYSTAGSFAISAIAIKPSTGGGGGGGGGTTFFNELLRWNDNANNETHIGVEWKHTTLPTFTQILFLPENSTSYNVQYTTETERCYRVQFYNQAGVSGYSNTLCSTVTAAGPILPTLAVPNIGGGSADD